MQKLRHKKPALILIDVQKGFIEEEYWGGNRNNKNAESNCGEILEKWRKLKLPIFHVRHSSLDEASKLYETNPGFEFMAGNFGYVTYIISDATATFDRVGIDGEVYPSELIHLTTLANLNKEFSIVWNMEKLLNTI